MLSEISNFVDNLKINDFLIVSKSINGTKVGVYQAKKHWNSLADCYANIGATYFISVQDLKTGGTGAITIVNPKELEYIKIIKFGNKDILKKLFGRL